MFEPRIALASLSGVSDAAWAKSAIPYIGTAFIGGIALCEDTQRAAEQLVARGRDEFLPADPLTFVEDQLTTLQPADIRPAINARCVSKLQLKRAAAICAAHNAIYEINAHCRQEEMCAVGAGESLLTDTDRLTSHVAIAKAMGATVSVKVRAEVPGVDLRETATAIADVGGDAIHVDMMDTKEVIREIAETPGLFVIANNGIRDDETVYQALGNGADAVSVGRASDDPKTLARVASAVNSERLQSPALNDR